jgi:hypothetical protein
VGLTLLEVAHLDADLLESPMKLVLVGAEFFDPGCGRVQLSLNVGHPGFEIG